MTASDGPLAEDPGWRRALVGLLPIVQVWISRGPKAPDGLVALRRIVLSFVSAPVLVGVVAATVIDPPEDPSPVPPFLGIMAVQTTLLAVLPWLRRPLPCEGAGGAYRSRMFLRIAFSEAIALTGFVAVKTTGEAWVFAVGLVPALVGIRWAAPTAGALLCEQERLTAAGCSTQLVAGLREPLPPRPRR
jgi:hypothetical protein